MSVKGKSTGAAACPIGFTPAKDAKAMKKRMGKHTKEFDDWLLMDNKVGAKNANAMLEQMDDLDDRFGMFSKRKMDRISLTESSYKDIVDCRCPEWGTPIRSADLKVMGNKKYLKPGAMVDPTMQGATRNMVGQTVGASELGPENLKRLRKGVTPDWTKKNLGTYAAAGDREFFGEAFSLYTSPTYKPGTLPKKIEQGISKAMKSWGAKTTTPVSSIGVTIKPPKVPIKPKVPKLPKVDYRRDFAPGVKPMPGTMKRKPTDPLSVRAHAKLGVPPKAKKVFKEFDDELVKVNTAWKKSMVKSKRQLELVDPDMQDEIEAIRKRYYKGISEAEGKRMQGFVDEIWTERGGWRGGSGGAEGGFIKEHFGKQYGVKTTYHGTRQGIGTLADEAAAAVKWDADEMFKLAKSKYGLSAQQAKRAMYYEQRFWQGQARAIHGGNKVKVYRGVRTKYIKGMTPEARNKFFSAVNTGQSTDILCNSVSSWTTEPSVAGFFAGNDTGFILTAEVDIDKMVWYGMEEAEVTLVGGAMKAQAFSAKAMKAYTETAW